MNRVIHNIETFLLEYLRMSNPKISSADFVAAYIEVHKSNGNLNDVAAKLDRDIKWVRGKKQAVSKMLKDEGLSLPSLQRIERAGSEVNKMAVGMARDYLSELEGVDTTAEV